MHKIIVKAGKINNLTDARYFAAESVQFMGFNLEEGTKGYLDPIYMRAIREWVEGPVIVGEFGQTPIPIVKEAAAFLGLEAVQIHMPGHVEDVAELSGMTLILEIDFASLSAALLTLWQPYTSVFLVRVTAEDCTESNFLPYADFPVIWSFDAPSPVIMSLIDIASIYGLEFIGGDEESVGVKSFDELNEIFEHLAEKTY